MMGFMQGSAGWDMLVGEFSDAEGMQVLRKPYVQPIFVVGHITKSYKPGLIDGTSATAAFRSPTFLHSLRSSSRPQGADEAVVVADTGNNALRLATARGGEWRVHTFASKTVWHKPRGICEADGTLFVSDSGHHRIKRVSLDGKEVSNFAGSGKKGYKDGPAGTAQFDCPAGLCVCPSDGAIIVADTGNNLIRKILNGVVTTIAGVPLSQEAQNGVPPPREKSRRNSQVDGEARTARFLRPSCVQFDHEGSLIVVDTGNHCLRVVSPGWSEVRTLAGGPLPGYADGSVDVCLMRSPEMICVLPDGSILVSDRENNRVRCLSADMKRLTTMAGAGDWGAADGVAAGATFDRPMGLCRLHCGDVMVCDSGNNCLRVITDAAQKRADTQHSLANTNGSSITPSKQSSNNNQTKQPIGFGSSAKGADGTMSAGKKKKPMSAAMGFALRVMSESSEEEEEEEEIEEEMAEEDRGVGAVISPLHKAHRNAWEVSRRVGGMDGLSVRPTVVSPSKQVSPGLCRWYELSSKAEVSSGGWASIRESLELEKDAETALQALELINEALASRYGTLRKGFAAFGSPQGTCDESEWARAARGSGVALPGDAVRGAFRAADTKGMARIDIFDVERSVRLIREWRNEVNKREDEIKRQEAIRQAREAEENKELEKQRELVGPREAERVRREVQGALGMYDVNTALDVLESAKQRVRSLDLSALEVEINDLDGLVKNALPQNYGHSVPNPSAYLGKDPKASSTQSKGNHSKGGVVYEVNAQLFKEAVGSVEGEWVYVSSCVLKADIKPKSPFWCILRWGQGSDARAYGCRFSGAQQAADLQSICRDALLSDWQRPIDSLLPRTAANGSKQRDRSRDQSNDVSRDEDQQENSARFDREAESRTLSNILANQMDNFEAALGALDIDTDGKLTPEELREAIIVLNEVEDLGMTQEQMQVLFGVAKVKKGCIHWHQYIEACRKQLPTLTTPSQTAQAASAHANTSTISSANGKPATKSHTRRGRAGVNGSIMDGIDPMKMAGRFTPRETQESLLASTSMMHASMNGTPFIGGSTQSNVLTASAQIPSHGTSKDNYKSQIRPGILANNTSNVVNEGVKAKDNVSASMVGEHAPKKEGLVGVDSGDAEAAVCESALEAMGVYLERAREEELGRGGLGGGSFQTSYSVPLSEIKAWGDAIRAGLGWLQERNRLRAVIPRYEDAVLHTIRRCSDKWEGEGGGGAGGGIMVGGRRYALVEGEDAVKSCVPPYDVLRDRRIAVLRDSYFEKGGVGVQGGALRDEMEQRLRAVSDVLRQSIDVGSGSNTDASILQASTFRREMLNTTSQSALGADRAKMVEDLYGGVVTNVGEDARMNKGKPHMFEGDTLVHGLMNLSPSDCAALEGQEEYYAKLTSLLAPEALLCEWQVSDSLGVGMFRDEDGLFYAVKGGAIWVRLTMWGFTYQSVNIKVNGHDTPVSGGVKFDNIKRGHYVMLRLSLSALEPNSNSLVRENRTHEATPEQEGQTIQEWKAKLRCISFALEVKAAVRQDEETRYVSLEGDMTVHIALCASALELATHGAALREDRCKQLVNLIPSLQPLGLLTVRSKAKATVIDEPVSV